MNTINTGVIVRSAHHNDRVRWEAMFDAYRSGAGLSTDPVVNGRLWSWICDTSNPVQALVAESAGGLLGFAHFRRFPRPIMADEGLFLDDLFTTPHARGRGVARALLDQLTGQVLTGDLATLRWTTKPSNTAARRIYESYGVLADSLTYDSGSHGAIRSSV